MRSGGGVLLVGSLQLLVGLVLLFIYEGYKSHYFDGKYNDELERAQSTMDPVPNPPGQADDNTNRTGTGTTIINNYAMEQADNGGRFLNTPMDICLLYTSPSPRDATLSRMPSSA